MNKTTAMLKPMLKPMPSPSPRPRLQLSSMLSLGLALGLAGCAKGPAGGPTTPQAVNRMTVSMTLQQPVNPRYFYDFAFDDNGNESDGPVALIGSSSLTNGVVGGSFGVLVECLGGSRFNVYRRTRVGNGEDLQLVPNAFVTQPALTTGTTLSFTLNLDATYTDRATGQQMRLFRSPGGGFPTALDINFVTSDEQRRDPNNNLPKTFDAFFFRGSSRYLTIRNLGTQSITNADTVQEPANDVTTSDTTGRVNTAQLDITDFHIDIVRSNA